MQAPCGASSWVAESRSRSGLAMGTSPATANSCGRCGRACRSQRNTESSRTSAAARACTAERCLHLTAG